ncbi:Transcription regulator LexA [Hyella patelloides LEGE 07179]|uniref:LexA repressor n=1 Tax=Hyella patelloides LEGE 07179 TaxID=945734 RepID=A0A563VT76_9CYAN|nr:transcriptional repressor LexA [Hyella patelloides]VEP14598.1 Transcription regulator LexA [Hyella patelloides LEGE 07179]
MESLTPAQQELYDWLVEYIRSTQHAPSIRQMMVAMNLRSPAPVQSRLERLRNKGYIDWTDGKARTLRILHQPEKGLSVLGTIAAGGLVEPFTDEKTRLDLSDLFTQSDCYVLRVTGDSMIEDSIIEGDFVVMRSVDDTNDAKNGDIVAARVSGYGTTLKRFYQEGNQVTLKPANIKYDPIKVDAEAVEIQGILVGMWREIATNN